MLGSTGEPWDPESYMWYFEKVGGGRCPIMNISGGTEIGACLLQPLPVMDLSPCTLGAPAMGTDADVFGEDARPIRGEVGHLVLKQPIPSLTNGFWKEPDRYLETYFSRWEGVWYHGDWAKVDEQGLWYLYGALRRHHQGVGQARGAERDRVRTHQASRRHRGRRRGEHPTR